MKETVNRVMVKVQTNSAAQFTCDFSSSMQTISQSNALPLIQCTVIAQISKYTGLIFSYQF